MEDFQIEKVEEFLQNEMLQLKFKSVTINKASLLFNLPKIEVEQLYKSAKLKIKKTARNRALVYLMLGSLFFGVGLFGTLSKTGFIFYGAILFGIGALITSIGLFRISFTK
jgi:hypothetical protein